MTSEEELRALDVEIHRKIMGEECHCDGAEWVQIFDWMRNDAGEPVPVSIPEYSTSMSAAWEVHKKACGWLFSRRRAYLAAIQELSRTECGSVVAWPDVLVVLRERMAEAICRAALKTCEAPT